MQKTAMLVLLVSLLIPAAGSTSEFSDLDYGVHKALHSLGINLDSVTQYLNWEMINISIQADMTSTTDVLGRHVQVDSRVYKREIARVRMDAKGELQLPRRQQSLKLKNVYVISYPIKDEAFMVVPAQKGFMKLDPEKAREMLGQLKEKLDDQDARIEKKEKLGTETIDGYLCDKIHVIMRQKNGIRNDITAWLAHELRNFPLRTIVKFTTPKGIQGTNITEFKNIERILPDMALFEIPVEYAEYDTLLELATGGKFGSRIKKRKDRKKIFQRR